MLIGDVAVVAALIDPCSNIEGDKAERKTPDLDADIPIKKIRTISSYLAIGDLTDI